MLLLCPVFSLTALVHRYLQLYAPSNILIARVRAARPRWHIAAALLLLALLLVAISGELDQAAATGAPSGLQLLAGVAAWDAIKLGTLSIHTAVRAFTSRLDSRPAAARRRPRYPVLRDPIHDIAQPTPEQMPCLSAGKAGLPVA